MKPVVMEGLGTTWPINEKLYQEKLDKIERNRDVQGPCPCGDISIKYRCELCAGPACTEFGTAVFCCECFENAANWGGEGE